MTRNRITDAAQALKFMLAGNATVTLVSAKTGERFTFKVRKPENARDNGPSHFVSLMSGPDNEGSFQYLGMIRKFAATNGQALAGFQYEHGRKSKLSADAPSAKGFAWFFRMLTNGEMPSVVECWHEGRCGVCGRKLTVPASIASGIGPECARKNPSFGAQAAMPFACDAIAA